MSDYICLMPGNWFELKNIIKEKTQPYDQFTFQDEIINQVNTRAEKLDFINISFGYKQHCLSEEIHFYLDEDKFSKMSELIQSESRHPIITFHGTSLSSALSILETGYVIPNNKGSVSTSDPKTKYSGEPIQIKHGAVYGAGIYSSPFFDKAMYYTDKTLDHAYIIINMVFPGVIKLIPPDPYHLDKKIYPGGKYADASNTHIVYGLEQLVIADTTRIIPIALMEIKLK